jgi:hypothetical protein
VPVIGRASPEGAVLIDCDSCAVRDLQCGDCVVTVLLGSAPGSGSGLVEVDDGERLALDVLADSGLVPRLRLVPTGLPIGVPDGSLESAAPPSPARERGVS